MTIFYPDVSGFQRGISFNGADVACIKATEGTSFFNSDYFPALIRAVSSGTFPFAYHFLHAGNATAQAEFCFSKVGVLPLMLDVEETTGSMPGVEDVTVFVDSYRKLGGIVWLCYLPRWYYQKIGSPNLAPLVSRGLLLVSSTYTAYTDAGTGAGWQPYGGMTPVIWQYTNKKSWNGFLVDDNAYRGTLPQLISLIVTGKADSIVTDIVLVLGAS